MGYFIQNLGFKPARCDPDLWIKSASKGKKYLYITMYTDDLIIVQEDTTQYLTILAKQYHIRDTEMNPVYYLGNDLDVQVKIIFPISTSSLLEKDIFLFPLEDNTYSHSTNNTTNNNNSPAKIIQRKSPVNCALEQHGQTF